MYGQLNIRDMTAEVRVCRNTSLGLFSVFQKKIILIGYTLVWHLSNTAGHRGLARLKRQQHDVRYITLSDI